MSLAGYLSDADPKRDTSERCAMSVFLQLYLNPLYILFYSKTLDPELVTAASAAASTLPNSSQVESELLRKLRQHESVTDSQRKGDTHKLGYVHNISSCCIGVLIRKVFTLSCDFTSV